MADGLDINVGRDPERRRQSVRDLLDLLAAWPQSEGDATRKALVERELSAITMRVVNEGVAGVAEELYGWATVAQTLWLAVQTMGELDGHQLSELDPLSLMKALENYIDGEIRKHDGGAG